MKKNIFNNLRENFKKKKSHYENPVLAGKIMKLGKGLGVMLVMLTISQITMSANGLPFYDKLELGLKILKVIGSVVAMASLVAMLVFANEGQRDAIKKGAWFVVVGIIVANIQWFADEFGLMAGAIF